MLLSYTFSLPVSDMEMPVVGWNLSSHRKMVRILNNLRTLELSLNHLLYLSKSNKYTINIQVQGTGTTGQRDLAWTASHLGVLNRVLLVLFITWAHKVTRCNWRLTS